MKVWVINQAVARKYEGVKNEASFGGLMAFVTEEDARFYLSKLIKQIKLDMKYNKRGKDNLDPNVALDFCITECDLAIPKEKMLKRGWVFRC